MTTNMWQDLNDTLQLVMDTVTSDSNNSTFIFQGSDVGGSGSGWGCGVRVWMGVWCEAEERIKRGGAEVAKI